MTISTINSRSYEINVIFTGSHYYFHSAFAGIVAVAARKGYATDEERDTFILRAGNRHLCGGSLGGSVIFSVAERFIRKNENKYVDHVVSFERIDFDGADCNLEINALVWNGVSYTDLK